MAVALVALDFDNVLIRGAHHLPLAEQAGRLHQMQELFDAARLGSIPVQEFVRQSARLLAGLPAAALQQTAASLPLRPGAWHMARTLRARGIPIIVISHGLLQAVEAATAPLGVDGVFACRALERGGVLTGEVDGAVLTASDKLAVVQREAARRGIPLEQCAAVGDGANDYDMLAGVGVPVGFNPVDALLTIPGLRVVRGDHLAAVTQTILHPETPGPARRGTMPPPASE